MEASENYLVNSLEHLVKQQQILTKENKQKSNPEEKANLNICQQNLSAGSNLIFCPICSKTFVEIRYLIDHLPLHNSKTPPLSKQKNTFRPSNSDVSSVNSQLHSNTELTCQICGEHYSSELTFRRHLLCHSGVKPFKCDTCKKSFPFKLELNKHLNKHHEENSFPCRSALNISRISNTEQSSSAEQIISVNKDVISENRKLEEQSAALNISAISNIENSQLVTDPNALSSNQPTSENLLNHSNKIPCSMCSKVFKTNSYLTLHLRCHNEQIKGKPNAKKADDRISDTRECFQNPETLVCEVDPDIFASQENLALHAHNSKNTFAQKVDKEKILETDIKISNHKEKSFEQNVSTAGTFKCVGCQKIFVGEKPLVCDNCQKKFPRLPNCKPNLKQNVSNLKMKKPYLCQECGKSFARKCHYIRHFPIHSNKMQNAHTTQKHLEESVQNSDGEKIMENNNNKKSDVEGKVLAKHLSTTNTFSCDSCQKVFVGEKPQACENCHISFSQRSDLAINSSSVQHDSKKNYMCEICGKNFNLKRKHTLHLQRHLRGKRFKCDVCEKFFFSSQALNKHVARHSSEGSFMCDECGLDFSLERDLTRHRTGISLATLIHLTGMREKKIKVAVESNLEKRNEIPDLKDKYANDNQTSNVKMNTVDEHPSTKNSFSCKFCQKVFVGENPQTCDNCQKELPELPFSKTTVVGLPSESVVKTTNDMSSDKTIFKCFFCSKVFSRINCLQVHVLSHSAEKVTCGVCGENFIHISTLYLHLRLHFREKPYKCNNCDKSFVRKDRLEKHLRVHSGEKPCLCEVCGRRFKSKRSYGVHLRIHNKDKHPLTSNRPFQCEICHAKFFTNFRLNKHRCAAVSSSQEPREKCSCYVCGKELFKDSLKRHLLSHSGEKFKCNVCGKSFSRKYGLTCHLVVHSGEQPYLCEFCGDKFSTRDKLRTHRLKHSDAKPFECKICHKRFFTDFPLKKHRCEIPSTQKIRERCSCHVCGKEILKSWLKNHLLSHSGEKPFKCEICERSFPCKLYLNKHLPIHSEEKPFPCDICGKKFPSKRHLSEHRRRHSDATRTKNFACEFCLKKLSSDFHLKNHRCETSSSQKIRQKCPCHVCGKEMLKTHLKNHLLSHTGERPFKCDVCGKSFTRKLNLNYHLPIHSGEKPFACEICGKTFASKKHLSDHRRHHSDKKCKKPEKNLTCEFCPKKFSDASKLKEHLRTHSGEKPFTCDICHRSFTQRGNLNSHRLHHEGVKAFLCEQCSKAFYTSGELKRHQQICNGEKPFKCEFCHKTFRSSSILCRHRRIHTGEKPFKCKVCSKSFRGSTHLKRHMRIHTGERPYKCNVCQKEFTQQFNLKTHLRTHSREAPTSSGLSNRTRSRDATTSSGLPNLTHSPDAPTLSGLPILSHSCDVPTSSALLVRPHGRAAYMPSNQPNCSDASFLSELPHLDTPMSSVLQSGTRSVGGHISSSSSNPQLSGQRLVSPTNQPSRQNWYY